MKKYVTAFLSLFDNENKIFIVEAENARSALAIGYVTFCNNPSTSQDDLQWVADFPEDIESACQCFFDGDICAAHPIELS